MGYWPSVCDLYQTSDLLSNYLVSVLFSVRPMLFVILSLASVHALLLDLLDLCVISLALQCFGVLTVSISVYARMVACVIQSMVLVIVQKDGQEICVIKVSLCI